MLIFIGLIATVFALPILRESELSFHLQHRHIWTVACEERGAACERAKNDFEDLWEDFEFKNGAVFPSKLF